MNTHACINALAIKSLYKKSYFFRYNSHKVITFL